ncbi:MAG: rhodanese-like domain-containing protein [Saprospiraceae bacterium]|nr:rhodanese-like domain-containing protein [Saprospiraceae bacterium]
MQHVNPEVQRCEVPRWHLLKSQLQNYSPREFAAKLSSMEDAVLIDVRTVAEHQEFSLPGSILMDYLGDAFLEDLEQLDEDKHYFVYCRSGRRSVRACTLMRNAGFNHVHHLDGGLVAWEQSNPD